MKTGLFAVLSADDVNLSALPTVTNAADKTATFSLTKTGGSWLVTSVCTDDQGTYTASLKIAVLNVRSLEEIAAGETTEASTAYGWLGTVNKGLRQAPGGSATQLQGYPVSATPPAANESIAWDGANYVPKKLDATNIAASAGITGTQVAPDFGAQVVKGAGYSAPSGTAFQYSMSAISYTSDANKTAAAGEYNCYIIKLSSTVNMTGTRDLVLPLTQGATWIIYNGTTTVVGGIIQCIGASGTGVTIANGVASFIHCADGANITKMVMT